MIGELINKFDNLRVTNVQTFNEIFPESRIPEKVEFNDKVILIDNWEVEIGELFGGTTRQIFITPPGQETFYTFIEMKNDTTYQQVLIKKRTDKKNRETYMPMIKAIINGTYQPESYGKTSCRANVEASEGIGGDDSGGFQEMDEEQDD